MSHAIFGEGKHARFVDRREAPWHGLGLVADRDISACEALAAVGGDYEVRLHPVLASIKGNLVELPQRQIVREPTPDDDRHLLFGLVGPQYQLLQPRDVAEIFDTAIGKTIETLGVLQEGRMIFVTCSLPTMDVKGDEVQRFLGITNPMDGERSASAEVWPLRVVCQNTLKAAQASAHVAYRVAHDQNARERLTTWLADAHAKALANFEEAQAAFTLLADTKLKDPQAEAIFKSAFPYPRAPKPNAPDKVMQKRIDDFLQVKDRVDRKREKVFALYAGEGVGMDTPAAAQSAWGAYNAIVEYCDFYGARSFRDEARQAEELTRIAVDTLFGDRADVKQRGFDLCLAAARGKFDFEEVSLN